MAQRETQIQIEVVRTGTANADLTRVSAEMVMAGTPHLRMTELIVERVIPFILPKKNNAIRFVNT